LTTLSRLLRELGINTLMVEGGAQIIEQFLSTSLAERPLVDSLVITVAPMLVPNGVGISARKSTVSAFRRIGLLVVPEADILGRASLNTVIPR
jgi:2,5-diamino-6-(ribosylamino)-4(3H)-pyrimidinone 5'-phosphate reductase